MKKYKIEHFIGRSQPYYITQISKTKICIGNSVGLNDNGTKKWQGKYKNDLLNGLYKEWYTNLKNVDLQNWKKNKPQGIEIRFKR